MLLSSLALGLGPGTAEPCLPNLLLHQGEQTESGEGLLGFAVGHHTHDADHQEGDTDASNCQHSLLVELLRFWKGVKTDVTKVIYHHQDLRQLNSWHAS